MNIGQQRCPKCHETGPSDVHWKCSCESNEELQELQQPMKTLTLTLEQACALSGQSDDLDKLIRENWTEDELIGKSYRVKRWEDLGLISGWKVYPDSLAKYIELQSPIGSNNSLFYTQQQALSFGIVYAKLTQLMARYRHGWEPDWSDENQVKYCVFHWSGRLDIDSLKTHIHPISFQSIEVANEFRKDHRDLILEFYKGM